MLSLQERGMGGEEGFDNKEDLEEQRRERL